MAPDPIEQEVRGRPNAPTFEIRLAFGTWPDGELDMPTLIAAVDEYTIDAWSGAIPDFYADAVDSHRNEYGDVRELVVKVPQEAVLALFRTPDPIDVEVADVGS